MMDFVNLVFWHRNGYNYENAVELLLKFDDKMSEEWEKNDAYFKSKAEMYEYYIGEDYEKGIERKKERVIFWKVLRLNIKYQNYGTNQMSGMRQGNQ